LTKYVVVVALLALVITTRIMQEILIGAQACSEEKKTTIIPQFQKIDQTVSVGRTINIEKEQELSDDHIWKQLRCVLEKNQASQIVSTSSSIVTHTNGTEKTLMKGENTKINEDSSSGIYILRKFEQLLEKISGYSLGILLAYFPQPHAGLYYGIVFGVSSQLTSSFKKQAIISGVLHVTAASGYNVAVIFHFFQILSRSISGKLVRSFLLCLAIFAYSSLAQFSPSIVRAMLMGYFQIGAELAGRRPHTMWSLILSCLIMLIYDPRLAFSISFQLSVAAAVGIIVFTTIFLNKKSLGNQFLESFLTAISANIAVMPILLLHFSEYSIISPFTNAIIGWTVPYLMGISALFLVVHMVPVIGWGVGRLLWELGSFFTAGVAFFSQLPFSQVDFKQHPLVKVLLLIFWGLCMLVLYYSRKNRKARSTGGKELSLLNR